MAYGLDVGYVRGGYKRAGLVASMQNDTLIRKRPPNGEMLSFLNVVLSYMTVIARSSNVYFLFSRKWIPAFVANKLFLTWSDTLDCLRGALPEPERQPYLKLSPYSRVTPCRSAVRWLQLQAFKQN